MQSRPNGIRSRCRFVAAIVIWGLPVPARLCAQADYQRGVPAPPGTSLGVAYTYSTFHGDIDAWHLVELSVRHRRAAGSVIGRVNIADQFATMGSQFEVDAYPTLGPSSHLYLNGGYSGSVVFPRWRFGSEIFQSLPRANEASFGFRHLRFDKPVTLYTGSIGRHTANYWFSLRPYVQDKETGVSGSATLTCRRYGADANNYVGARIGFGSVSTDHITAGQLTSTSSDVVGLHGSRTATIRTVVTWSLSYEHQHLLLGRTRNELEIGGGLSYRF